MMIRGNRKAEEFDRALSASGSAADPTMAALVAVAGALTALPQRPAPAFREGLRAKLMAEAAQLAASAPAASIPAASAPASPLQSLTRVFAKPAMQVATGGLAATIAATGVGVGASRSLPGDPLYGLKRAVESLQEDLAGGTLAEAGSVLEHAETRIDEVLALLDRGAPVGDIESALNDLKADVDTVTADLLAQARAGSRAAYDKLGESVRELTSRLMALRSQLPVEARDELDASMATLNAAGAQLAALPVPGEPGPTTSPSPTTGPSTSGSPTPTKPSSPTSTTPSSPSTTGVPSPTISLPTVTPPPTLPTVTPPPTLPVTLPPLLP